MTTYRENLELYFSIIIVLLSIFWILSIWRLDLIGISFSLITLSVIALITLAVSYFFKTPWKVGTLLASPFILVVIAEYNGQSNVIDSLAEFITISSKRLGPPFLWGYSFSILTGKFIR
jgi:hypothetical protein